MASLAVVTGCCLLLCLSVSLHSCHANIEPYGVLSAVLNSPLRDESGVPTGSGVGANNPSGKRNGLAEGKTKDVDDEGVPEDDICHQLSVMSTYGMAEKMERFCEKLRLLLNLLKISSVLYLDKFLSRDVIPVTQLVEFVRDVRERDRTNSTLHDRDFPSPKITSVGDVLKKDWCLLVAEMTDKFLRGHSLRIRLSQDPVRGRGRRRHHMFAVMMIGFMIMSSILIPMGFQFLTVLGGKSLLMAKMALIMSAINGLKKIATSNVGYGLYHYPADAIHHELHHHDFHDKIFHPKPHGQKHDLPYNIVI